MMIMLYGIMRNAQRKKWIAANPYGRYVSDKEVREMFYGAMKRAGLGHRREGPVPFVFHDLRHTFGTRFCGEIGRDNVAVFYQNGVERSSDMEGLVYIPLAGDWEKVLVRELCDAGRDFSLDRLHR